MTITLGKNWIEKLKRGSVNSDKREVTGKLKEFKYTDIDFDSDQSDETIPQDGEEESYTSWYTVKDV